MNTINKILICMFLLTNLASATITTTTTYSCCKNFTTNSGTIQEQFNNFSEWVLVSNGNAAIYNDSINLIDNHSTILLSPHTASSVSATKLLTGINQFTLQSDKTFGLWVYSPDWNNTGGFTIELYNDTGMTKGISKETLKAYYSTVSITQEYRGWVLMEVNTSQFSNVGVINRTDTITKLKIKVYPRTSGVDGANISFGKMILGYTVRPKLIFRFDDGKANITTMAFPTMQANNQKGIMFASTSAIGLDESHATLAQLHTMYSAGWDISSHTVNHVDLTAQSPTNLRIQLNDSYDYLIANGFLRSAQYIAYPTGAYNQAVLNAVADRYMLGTTVDLGTRESVLPKNDPDTMRYRINEYSTTTNSVANIEAEINNTIARGGLLQLMTHDIQNNEATYSLELNKTDFITISDYVYSRRADIDVITYTDMLDITTTTTGHEDFTETQNIIIDLLQSIINVLKVITDSGHIIIKAVFIICLVSIVIYTYKIISK